MLPTYVLSIVIASTSNAAVPGQQGSGAVSALPDHLDCAYRSPASWLDAIREGVARGEIADPAKRELPALPPVPAKHPRSPDGSSALVGPTCFGPGHLFLFEDTNQLLLTDFSDAQLVDLMTQGANALLAGYGDNYDFVGFWTNFTSHHELGAAFYVAVSNDVSGIGDPSTIGTPIFDHHAAIGLAGQEIQGYVMMWNVDHPYWEAGTGSGADFTRLALGHEFEHRFATFLPPLPDGRILQGDDASCGRTFHWNWRVDGQGSAMEISEWVGASPSHMVGSFVTFNTDTGGLFSYTDLYLMGYVSPVEMDAGNSELRFMNASPCAPSYGGPISNFSSADIVATAGARSPDSTASQKDYRAAWIVIHQPGLPPTPAQTSKLVGIIEQRPSDWSFGTLGRGTVDDTLFDDCNCNDVPDATDIADLTVLDGNQNGIPDSCEPVVGTAFCLGDGTGDPCPCGNEGAGGHGCGNSEHSAGGLLVAAGTTNPDTVALDVTNLRTSSLTLFFKGDASLVNAVTFGDGLRCVGGALRRFGAQMSTGGTATFPGSIGGTLSGAGFNTPGSGQVAYYQAFYRDGAPAYCTVGRTNASNGVQVVW